MEWTQRTPNWSRRQVLRAAATAGAAAAFGVGAPGTSSAQSQSRSTTGHQVAIIGGGGAGLRR